MGFFRREQKEQLGFRRRYGLMVGAVVFVAFLVLFVRQRLGA